jgi:SAM-dependent methyltransferase
MFIKYIYDLVPKGPAKQYSSRMLINELSNILNYKSSSRICVLDLGCGDGKSIDWFKQCCLDIDWKGLDIEDSPEVNSRKRSDGEFYTYNGINIPFADSSFDVVFSNQVFEHVRHPEVLLREINRVLRKDGIFLGSVSYLEPFHSYSLFNFTPYGWYTINIDNGLTPILLAGGVDGLGLMERKLGRTKPEDNIWSCSPLNKSIIEDKSLSDKRKNYEILMNAGHIVFISKKN